MAEHSPERSGRRRKILILLTTAAVVGIAVVGGLYKVSSSPLLCSSCHIMTPYVEAWRTSKHNMVTCVEAPRERCNACHNQPEKLERYGDTEFIHDFHVAGRNIECARCHSEIKHRLPPLIGVPRAVRDVGRPSLVVRATEGVR
jgi:nitrate/TMAO reductase-like tetraheme cytochrome c subunit